MYAKLLFAALVISTTPTLAAAKTPIEIAREQNACNGADVLSAERLDNKRIQVTCGTSATSDTVLPAEEVGEATNIIGVLGPILGLGAAGAAVAAGSGSSSGTSTSGTN